MLSEELIARLAEDAGPPPQWELQFRGRINSDGYRSRESKRDRTAG